MEPSATNTASLEQLSVVGQGQTLSNSGFPCDDDAPPSAIGDCPLGAGRSDCAERSAKGDRGLLSKGFQENFPLKPVIELGARKIKELL